MKLTGLRSSGRKNRGCTKVRPKGTTLAASIAGSQRRKSGRIIIRKEKRRKKKISRCSARCQPYSYKPEHLTGVKDEWGRVMKPRVRPRLEWWEAFMTKEKNRAAFQRVWNITEEEMKGRDEDLARRKAAKEERMS